MDVYRYLVIISLAFSLTELPIYGDLDRVGDFSTPTGQYLKELPGVQLTASMKSMVEALNLDQVDATKAQRPTATSFSVSGDLSQPDKEISGASVKVQTMVYRNGKRTSRVLGTVILDSHEFLIEGEVDEPTVVTIHVSLDGGVVSTPAVIEPGSSVFISWYENTDELLAVSDSKRHTTLVESWQQAEEYLARVDRHFAFLTSQSVKSASRVTEALPSSQISPNTDETLGASNAPSSVLQKQDAVMMNNLIASASQKKTPVPVGKCKHITLEELRPGIMDLMRSSMSMNVNSKLSSHLEEIHKFKTTTLQDIARNTENPFNSLLALEMGAFGEQNAKRREAIPILDEISTLLDEDIVERRVRPRRDRVMNIITAESNDDLLIRGQQVPDFELANLEDEPVALYSVLDEANVVLIDFWASWCAPCIEKFPGLKRLYTQYRDEGFEVVSVSVDSKFDDWKESSIQQSPPWINLGEIKGMEGPIAVDYGVRFLPKNYLVDTHGCILTKDLITNSEVKEFLDAHFTE